MKSTITRLLMICVFVIPLCLQAQWQPLNSGTDADLQDIYFLNEAYGVAVGSLGTVLLTTNGGDTWTDIGGDLTSDLRSVVIWNTDTILVGNGNIFESVIYRTTDGGASWQAIQNIAELARAGDRIHGLWSQALVRSDNAGADWLDSGTNIGGTTLLEQLVFADQNFGQAIGNISGFATYSTYAYMTEDGGNSWQSWYVFDLPNADAWTAAAYPHPDTLFLFTNQYDNFMPSEINKMVRLTDFFFDDTPGFDGWRFTAEIVNDAMPTYSNAGYFLNGSTGFSAGADGNLYRTDNGGASWAVDYDGTGALFGFFFGNNAAGYAVGEDGKILRRQGPSGTGEPTILELKFFPNPTAESIWMQGVDAPDGLLNIFDASGRLVKTGKWRSGQEIDVQALSPGIYELRLQTNRQVWSGKLSKVK